MKIGETYRSKWNHYVATVVDMGKDFVILESKQGVRENVSFDNFSLNWKSCDMLAYKDAIDTAFIGHDIRTENDSIIVDNSIRFRLTPKSLQVEFALSMQYKLGLSYSTMEFDVDEVESIVYMIADLVNDEV